MTRRRGLATVALRGAWRRYEIPVPGQWGSTKRSQIGIFRDGIWNVDVDGDYVWNATNDRAITFGGAGDVPVVFVRP